MISLPNHPKPSAKRNHARPRIHHVLWVITLLSAPAWAAAQPPGCGRVCELYGDLLMAPERDLIGSIRTLEKVAKPAVGPRNTRGRWIQRDAYIGTETFDTTFYVKSGLVQRIELVSNAPDAQCRARTPWSDTIAALEAWQGKQAVSGQFDTGNSVQQSVQWASDILDVSVYLSISSAACSTTVVFKKHDAKDASEL